MKNTDLYGAFGEISDELIERAGDEAVKNGNGVIADNRERKEVKVKKKINWKRIGKYAGGVVAACLVLVLSVSLLTGGMFRMGSSKAAAESPAMAYDSKNEGYYYGGPAEAPAAMAEEEGWGYHDYNAPAEPAAPMTGETSHSGLAIQNSGIKDKDVKLVYTAYMEVQTLDYAEAESKIYALVEQFGGYLESTYRYNGGYYSNNSNQNGSYTVRIPAEHYADFVNGLGETCHVVNIDQSVEDITLSYADVEKRLATLETKYERLLDLLSKATNMEDIIDLENAIAECEYQIDNYTSTKNRYDSLVNYSTITIELSEVSRLAEPVKVDNSFFARLGRTLKNGLNNVLDSLDDFVMWFTYNIVGIIIFVVIVILVRKYLKKHPIRRRKKNEDSES